MGPLNTYFLLNMVIFAMFVYPEARYYTFANPPFPPHPKTSVLSSLQAMAMTACPGRASRSSLPKPPPPKAKATPKVSLAAVGLFFVETIWRWPGVSWNLMPKPFLRPGENHMEVGYHGIRDNCFRAAYL